MQRKLLFFIIYIILIGVVQYGYSKSIRVQKNHFIETNHSQFINAHEVVQHKINLIYQGLTVIARLPEIRNIAIHNNVINQETKNSIASLYFNLEKNVKLSGVYIARDTFKPDKTDSKTQKFEIPVQKI